MMETTIKKRLLVVDDAVHVRLVVQACLENLAGWETILADSAETGLRLAEMFNPDAILLDGMMPGIDGVTFLGLLHANPTTHEIPVVFLTAKAELIEPEQYLPLGVKGAIAKPFDPLTLANHIAQILGW